MKPAHIYKSLLLTALLIPGASNAQLADNSNNISKSKQSKTSVMQNNKETVKRLYEESLNKRNMELLKELVSDDYTGLQGQKGIAGFEAPVTALIKAFPDIQWKIDELIGDGDQVVVKWTIQGTHTGQFQYIAPTGKKVTGSGIGIYELKDGKVTATQVLTDRLGFLQDLGALPADLSTLANRQAKKGQVYFIDKFLVPPAGKQEFYERTRVNREFIKQLPGFIEDAAYEYTDNNGNLVCVTVALWESPEALNKAREAVQSEYKKTGFDAAAMLKRLNITADRGVYTAVGAH